MIILFFSSTTPFHPTLSFYRACSRTWSRATAISSCHGSPQGPLHGFLGGLVWDPFHGYCKGLPHVHDAIHDSCHKDRRGCGSARGPLCVQSHVLLRRPAHLPSCGTSQGPALCPGPDQGRCWGPVGNMCHYLPRGRESIPKREKII